MAHEDQPKLCIVVAAAMGQDAIERVSVVLDSADIGVLLVTPASVEPFDAAAAGALVGVAQAKGVPVLIEGDAQLARAVCADGVHMPWSKDTVARYGEARQIMGSRLSVGADAGPSRDDAMALGEAGADYVGFGIPANLEEREMACARRLALIEWWSEIFEVPCIAFDVETSEDAAVLAHAGADFVALAMPTNLAVKKLACWAQDLAAAVAGREATA
jgi:thiamine-phosphate pyrophosphorylase